MKNFLKKLNENSSRDLIIVDIQPAYKDGIYFDMYEFADYINENADNFNRIFFLYNGEELGLDSWQDISYWYEEHGLDSITVSGEEFEKNYGFFRDLMDNSVDYDDIVNIGKYMLQNNITMSSEIERSVLESFELEDEIIENILNDGYNMYIPDVSELLENVTNPILVGGGQDECLAEVEILLQILDKDYSLNHDWIY